MSCLSESRLRANVFDVLEVLVDDFTKLCVSAILKRGVQHHQDVLGYVEQLVLLREFEKRHYRSIVDEINVFLSSASESPDLVNRFNDIDEMVLVHTHDGCPKRVVVELPHSLTRPSQIKHDSFHLTLERGRALLIFRLRHFLFP